MDIDQENIKPTADYILGSPSSMSHHPAGPRADGIVKAATVIFALAGLVISINLAVQLARYDIYWNQDLPGFLALIINYAALGIAGLFQVIGGISTITIKRFQGLASAFFLISWGIMSIDIWVQAHAYGTAAVYTFPTMNLWWAALFVMIATVITISIKSSRTMRVVYGCFGLLFAVGIVISINVAENNITDYLAQAEKSDADQAAIQAAVEANDPERCIAILPDTPPSTVQHDSCYLKLIAAHKRIDLCPLLSAEVLKGQISNGNCPPNSVYQVNRNTNGSAATKIIISNISTSVVGQTLKISWEVSPKADAIVNWGPDTTYGQYLSDQTFAYQHTISIPITSDQTIHYAIRSCTIAETYVCGESGDRNFSTIE